MERKLVRRYHILFLLFSGLLPLIVGLFSLGVYAAEESLFAAGIFVTLPQEQEVEPDEAATYIFRVVNRTAKAITLKARAVSTQGWPLLGPTEELVLAPGGEEYVVCSLLVPSSVTAGTEDQLHLFLSGDNKEKEYTVRTKVKAVRHLKWKSLPLIRAEAGADLFIPVRLLNLGTTPEQLDLDISSEKGWSVYWHSPTAGPLDPGQSREILLSLLVPPATPAGTLEEITLRLHDGGPEAPTLNIKILITETQTAQRDQDLVIPISSAVNFSYLPPTTNTNLPWNLIWRSSGNLFPDTRIDIFFSGTHETHLPTTTYVGVTGDQWALRLGDIGHNWDGPVPPPTYSSFLYFQDQRELPWSLWVGPTTAENTPLWWGTKFELPQANLRFNYMQNLEQERYYQHALSATYQLYSSPLYGWKFTTQGAVGLGEESSPLTQGGIALNRRAEDWEVIGEYNKGTDFYTLSIFDELALSGYAYTTKDLRLASGYTWRKEDQPTAPLLRSNKVWTELAAGDYRLGLAHTHRSDGRINEIKAGTMRRQAQNMFGFSASYIHEDLLVLRQSLLLSGRYRFRFASENYLEALLSETFTYEQTEVNKQPELGLRWRYSPLRNPWSCFGLVFWDLSEPLYKINSFQTGLSAQTATGTTWQIYAQLFYRERDPVYSMIFRLQHHDLFYIPPPWSGLHGKAFIDLDRNGLYSPDEPVLSGLPIIFNGRKETVTDADGNWEIPFSGTGLQFIEFPAQFGGYYTLQTRKEIITEPQKSVAVLVPYLPPTEVHGLLTIDTSEYVLVENDRAEFSQVSVAVFDHNNHLVIEKGAEHNGTFFLNLLPGEYRLEVIFNSPDLGEVYEQPHPVTFKVTTASPLHLTIPVRPVSREIEFFH
ncbi:MAG: hypothetical protein GX770_06085 [Firmicutes bacterium]|nr:hypothetical protein [Bacillota bacterium]